MKTGVYPINSPKQIASGALINNFDEDDVLVIALDCVLQFYRISNGKKYYLYDHYVFGIVSDIIPIKHAEDTKSNIMVVLKDLRFCVLRYEEQIITVQTGSLRSSYGIPMKSPYMYSIDHHAFLIQTHHNVISYYHITPHSTLSYSYNLLISSDSIIDIGILSSSDSLVKVAVLFSEEESKIKVRVFESNDQNRVFSEHAIINLEQDSYKMKVIDSSTIVILTTSSATLFRLTSAGSSSSESSSIYTSHPLRKWCDLTTTLSLAIDENNSLIAISIPKDGKIVISRIGSIPLPVSFLRMSSTSAISITGSGQSYKIMVNGSKYPPTPKIEPFIESSGSIRSLIPYGPNNCISISENSQPSMIEQTRSMVIDYSINIPGVLGLWYFGGPQMVLISLSDSSRVLEINDGINIIEKEGIIVDSNTLSFSYQSDEEFVQIVPNMIVFKTNQGFKNHEFDGKAISTYSLNGWSIVGFEDTSIICYKSDGSEVFRYNTGLTPNAVSICEEICVVADWSRETVQIFDLSSLTLTKEIIIENISSVAFVDTAFVCIQNHHCLRILSENSDRTEFYDGFLSKLQSQSDGSLFVCGDYPFITDTVSTIGIPMDPISLCDSYDDSIVVYQGDTLHFGTLEDNQYSYIERSFNYVLDAFYMSLINMYCVVYSQNDKLSIGLSDHPLFDQKNIQITELVDNGYIGMTSVISGEIEFLAVLVSKKLLLYQPISGVLHPRSVVVFENQPQKLAQINNLFVVAFENELLLYSHEIISSSHVKLTKILSHPTQGSTSSISVNESRIAIGDELESVVVYTCDFESDPPKFKETLRNSNVLGITNVIWKGDDLLAADKNGCIYSMQSSEQKNMVANEILITASYNIGTPITAMILQDDHVYIGTASGQVFRMIELQDSPDMEALLNTIESSTKSLGNLLPSSQTQVIHMGCKLPQRIANLQLISMFLQLQEEEQALIAEKCGFSIDTALSICNGLLH